MNDIEVIGLGYIGLPTAAAFAHAGFRVHGTDISPAVANQISSGSLKSSEPGLAEFVSSVVRSGRLTVSTEVEAADVIIFCVPTPLHESAGMPSANLDAVYSAAESCATKLRDGGLVIIESTCPVGTTEQVARRIAELTPVRFLTAYCPERVLPGRILEEIQHNDRIIGGLTPEAAERAAALYSRFVKGVIRTTGVRTAEMCKLVENSYRDINIAFANEVSILAERLGVNVDELISLANCHPRVHILKPGVGVGGHCIAVDPWFMASPSPGDAALIRTAREVNTRKTRWVVEKAIHAVRRYREDSGRTPTVCCLGATFKPDVSDLRASPALYIARALRDSGLARVILVEPHVRSIPGFELWQLEDALAKADLLVGLVAHKVFSTVKETTLKPHQRLINFS